MQIVLLVVHILIALSLIGVVMLQKSEGGGLGIGGGGGGMSGLMTGRGTANLLTRTTAVLFAALILSSIVLTVLAARDHAGHGSIVDRIAPSKPLSAGSAALPAGKPAVPQDPIGQKLPGRPVAPLAAPATGSPPAPLKPPSSNGQPSVPLAR